MSLFEKARRYYEKGWWTLATLEALVTKGKLTPGQVAEITGTAEEIDFSAMTKAELLAYCSEHGIEAYESWTKAEIVAAIEGAE